MTQVEIAPRPGESFADAAARIGAAASALGLTVTLRGTLAAHPGCRHWHFKRGKAAGTLEATLMAAGAAGEGAGRILLVVHANRAAGWTGGALREIAAVLSVVDDLSA